MMMFPNCKGVVSVYETNTILFPRNSKYCFFGFIVKSNYVKECNYPKETTKIFPLSDNEIYVECEENFTAEERQIVEEFNITSVKDFLQHDQFSKNAKKVCIECYRYVKDIYELDGEEPDNGHDIIKIQGRYFLFRILPSGHIKYCRPLASDHLIENLALCYQSIYVRNNLLKNT